MKNLKNISLPILLIIATTATLTAFTPPINFELYNKDPEQGRIKLTLLVGNTPIIKDKIIDSGEWFQAAINQYEPVKVTIFKVNQQYEYYVINAPSKTKFLSWNPSKSPSLYPQTGPMMGLMGRYQHYIPGAGAGKTETGLHLHNNVTENQIIRKQ